MKGKLAAGTLSIALTVLGQGCALAEDCKSRQQLQEEPAPALRIGQSTSGDAGRTGAETYSSHDDARRAAAAGGGDQGNVKLKQPGCASYTSLPDANDQYQLPFGG